MLSPLQKEERRSGIGGSEAAAVLGVSPYKTAMEVWLEKTGRLTPEELSEKPAVYWGSRLEDVVAEEYMRRTGQKVNRVNRTLRHPRHPWMVAHLDRKIVGSRKLLECKTASFRSAREWGEPGTDAAPEHYLVQVQHYLAVTGFEAADIAVLIEGNDFRIYPVKRDEELIALMIAQMEQFWMQHVLTDIPPQPNTRLEASLLWREDNGAYVDVDDAFMKTLLEFKSLKEESARLEKQREALESRLTVQIGEASGARFAGEVVATWKANKRGIRTFKLRERST